MESLKWACDEYITEADEDRDELGIGEETFEKRPSAGGNSIQGILFFWVTAELKCSSILWDPH